MTKIYKSFIICAVSLLLLSLYMHFIGSDASPDKEIAYYTARAWLSGKLFYKDLFTVSPPLIYYIYALPVALSKHLGLFEDFHYLFLLGVATIAFVIFVALKIIRFHPEFANNQKRQLEFCLLLATVLIALQNPLYFFEREHIFYVLTLAYVLRFAPYAAKADIPRYLRIIIGIMAGIGFCIKPQCVIVFAGVNLVYLIRERSLSIIVSIENIIIYCLVSLYVLSIWIFNPDYITIVLPMTLATYSASNAKLGGMIYFFAILLSYGITFADFRLRYTSPYRKNIYYLLTIAVFFLGYALSNNGWGYTWSLLSSTGFIITGFVLWEHLYLKEKYESEGQPSKPFLSGIYACLICFAFSAAFIPMYIYLTLTSCGDMFRCAAGKEFIQTVETANNGKPITTFGAISMDLGTWSFLNRAIDAKWETRFNHLWMYPKFFVSDAEFARQHKWITDYVSNSYAEDLERNKPELIFVDDVEAFYIYHKYVDLVAYLQTSPQFSSAWAKYQYAGKVDYPSLVKSKSFHHGFTIYKRIN